MTKGYETMKTMKRMIPYGAHSITYTLLIKQVKNINMHMEQNGEIIVSANAYVPIERIDDFVSSKITWILKHQEQLVRKNRQVLRTDDEMMLLGKQRQIKYQLSSYEHVTYDEDTIHILIKPTSDKQKVLQRFLDKLCKDIFYDIAIDMHQRLSDYRIVFPTIKLRTMTSRWGSCIPSKHSITLNKNMIHYPIAFIEYVILHEFVHFIQPNHSKAFYHVIENHMPDYKARIKLAR